MRKGSTSPVSLAEAGASWLRHPSGNLAPMPSNQDERAAEAIPRDAATVVVMRNGNGRVEIFCVERHPSSAFMGGAIVFPGGKVDPGDRNPCWDALSTPLRGGPRNFSDDPSTARAFAVAALRETLEEAALLPVLGDDLDDSAVRELQRARQRGQPFSAAVEEAGLVLDTARLQALSRWITPTVESRRFDTRFYLLAAPPRQHGAHDGHETTRGFWATAADILARWERLEIRLAPPTSFTLELFRDAVDVEAALAIARTRSLAPTLPFVVQDAGETILALPGDPLHPTREVPENAEGPTRFILVGTRFVSRRP